MGDGIKRMDIREFRERGLLQEINRQFLHPRGLALEVIIDEEGNESLGGIWDCRDDPLGVSYGNPPKRQKEQYSKSLLKKNARNRYEKLGYIVQPTKREEN